MEIFYILPLYMCSSVFEKQLFEQCRTQVFESTHLYYNLTPYPFALRIPLPTRILYKQLCVPPQLYTCFRVGQPLSQCKLWPPTRTPSLHTDKYLSIITCTLFIYCQTVSSSVVSYYIAHINKVIWK